MAENEEKIWQDRKRHFGLPLSFTRYAISQDRLFLSTGFFTIKDDELLLYRVRDISTTRTLWQRLFGVGSITIMTSDKTSPTLVLENVKNPTTVKELLHDQVEQMKLRRRVRVGEVLSNRDDDVDAGDDLSDDDLNDLP